MPHGVVLEVAAPIELYDAVNADAAAGWVPPEPVVSEFGVRGLRVPQAR
jgi:hypothetical protein